LGTSSNNSSKSPGRDNHYGWGRAHPHRALEIITSGEGLILISKSDGRTTTGIDPLAAVDGETLSKSVSVYPNPASNFMNINIPGGSVSEVNVYDISGRVVFQEKTGNDITWDLTNAEGSKVSPGVYIITVDDGSERIVKKAVIR
jgi:hypothetical protein